VTLFNWQETRDGSNPATDWRDLHIDETLLSIIKVGSTTPTIRPWMWQDPITRPKHRLPILLEIMSEIIVDSMY